MGERSDQDRLKPTQNSIYILQQRFAMRLPVSNYCQFKDRKHAKELAKLLCYDHTPKVCCLRNMVYDTEGHCKLGEAQRMDVLTEEQIIDEMKNQYTVQISDNHGLEK